VKPIDLILGGLVLKKKFHVFLTFCLDISATLNTGTKSNQKVKTWFGCAHQPNMLLPALAV